MDGNIIRTIRKEKKITVKELAEKIGFTGAYISQIERNKIDPSISALEKIAKALDVNISVFFENAGNVPYVIKRNQRKIIEKINESRIELIYPYDLNEYTSKNFFVSQVIIESKKYDKDKSLCRGNVVIIVNKGEILVEIDEEDSIMLDEGDALFFQEGTNYRCYNYGLDISSYLLISNKSNL